MNQLRGIRYRGGRSRCPPGTHPHQATLHHHIRLFIPRHGPRDKGPERDQQQLRYYTEYCLWYLDNHIPSCVAARDNIAGILVELGLAEGGNWIPSTRFLSGIRDICNKNDWLMISDEVLTGLGRTGRMWGIEHYDFIPDILVYGKNLSGGVAPLCGISARDDIMGDNTEFASGSTFAGMPAGCAAGIKTLEIFERDDIVAHAKRLGDIAAGIMSEWESYGIVRQARGNGRPCGTASARDR